MTFSAVKNTILDVLAVGRQTGNHIILFRDTGQVVSTEPVSQYHNALTQCFVPLPLLNNCFDYTSEGNSFKSVPAVYRRVVGRYANLLLQNEYLHRDSLVQKRGNANRLMCLSLSYCKLCISLFDLNKSVQPKETKEKRPQGTLHY